jgi:hydrogenase maturation protein HypF
VQHHHAHIASVMAEHGLAGPVIGVAFDGTGYGEDGAVWGGEVLFCEGAGYERFSHLAYVDMLGGDESMREAWKAGVAYARTEASRTGDAAPGENALREFTIDIREIVAFFVHHDVIAAHWDVPAANADAVARAIAAGVNTVRSASMGRLFDAVSAMLGICAVNAYEGQCASMLETEAARADDGPVQIRAGASDRARLAWLFHRRVAEAILEECRAARTARGASTVCLSGGVFQNKLLMEEALRLLRGDAFEVYYNVHVPPNDGGIALGQCYLGMLRLREARAAASRPYGKQR